jgi:hypothetical protein
MFKLAEKRIITWPVIIPVPQDGGKVHKHQVSVQFEMIDDEEFQSIYTGGGTDRSLMERTLVDWREGEFQDAQGQPLLFNEENKQKILKVSYVRAALTQAYLRAHQGREAERKN